MRSVMHANCEYLKNELKEKNGLIKSLLENTKLLINKNWPNPVEVKKTVISSLANYEADLSSQKHKNAQVKKSNVVLPSFVNLESLSNPLDDDPDFNGSIETYDNSQHWTIPFFTSQYSLMFLMRFRRVRKPQLSWRTNPCILQEVNIMDQTN